MAPAPDRRDPLTAAGRQPAAASRSRSQAIASVRLCAPTRA
ncbi:hypothetical protein [Ornithinimicrobium kibberense]